jgi:hypothetical protein
MIGKDRIRYGRIGKVVRLGLLLGEEQSGRLRLG